MRDHVDRDDHGVDDGDHRATTNHHGAAAYDDSSAPDDHGSAAHPDRGGERVGGTVSDVTVHVPTAHGVLTAPAPDGVEVTADDIIKFQAAQLAAAHGRIQELEVAVQTIVNIAACALKVLADAGLADAPDEFSFSYDLAERMRDTNITATRDFAGGITVKFREQSPAAILVER